jgi:hypothetical protein
LGGVLHTVHFPNPGPIMAGIGMAIMSAHVGAFRRPAMIPMMGAGAVAALFKLLDGLIVGSSITSPFVVNPATAIVFEALAFGVLVALRRGFFAENLPVRAVTYVGSGFAGFGLWAAFESWQSLGQRPMWTFSEKLGQVWHDGGLAGLLGMAFALAACAVATRGRSLSRRQMLKGPGYAYGSALSLAVVSWISAFAIFKMGAFGN